MARLSGKNAALYVCLPATPTTFVWIADLYDWVVEVRTITLAARIKGDRWDRRVPSHGEGKLTARRYVNDISPTDITGVGVGAAVLAPLAVNAIPTIAASTFAFTSGYRVQWAVMGVDSGFPAGGNPANFNAALFSAQGTGYVDQGHQGAPRVQLEDDFAMIIDTLVGIH
jgi:hypothetical protein